jgi:uncharacterized protein
MLRRKKKEKIDYELLVQKALLFPVEKVLVIADLHIGHEEAMNAAGIFMPRIQFRQMVEDLESIFKRMGKLNEIIINGDLKHEFGRISGQEWRETLDIIEMLEKNSGKVILIKGNHDTILEPIVRRKKIEIRDCYIKDIQGTRVCFLHGDKLFSEAMDKKVGMIVMGHRHPAVILSDKYKKERYKCFLVGKWKEKEVIILPSFFPLVEGTDIVTVEENNSLFIDERDLREFDVFAIGDKVYEFGKVKKIGSLVR